MAALVQSFPITSSTITMLQTRPSSSEAFQNGGPGQQHQRGPQGPRTYYNTPMGGTTTTNYRGHTSMAPSTPYAYTAPSVNGANPLRQHPTMSRGDIRTASAPVIPLAQQSSFSNAFTGQNRLPNNASTSPNPALSTAFSTQQIISSKDDTSVLASNSNVNSRPLSAIDLNSPTLAASLSSTKPVPDRYRRNHRRAETTGTQMATSHSQGGSAEPSGSGMATVGHLYNHPLQTNSTPTLTSYPSYQGSPSPSRQINDPSLDSKTRVSSVDDMSLPRSGSTEQAKRYRRRSINSMNAEEYATLNPELQAPAPSQPKTYAAMLASPAPQALPQNKSAVPVQQPGSSHGRNASAESSNSGHSSSRSSVSTFWVRAA